MCAVMKPEFLWWISTRLYQKRWVRSAKLLKTLNFLVFNTVLPVECEISRDIELWHRGLGTVIHPNVRIGSSVKIGHGVTIAGTDAGPMIIEDGVKITAGAIVLPRSGKPLTIGRNSVIGAGSVVVSDVPAAAVVAGNPATETSSSSVRRVGAQPAASDLYD